MGFSDWLLGSGKVTTNATIENTYYNQFSVSVSYNIVGSTVVGTDPPTFTGTSFGSISHFL